MLAGITISVAYTTHPKLGAIRITSPDMARVFCVRLYCKSILCFIEIKHNLSRHKVHRDELLVQSQIWKRQSKCVKSVQS